MAARPYGSVGPNREDLGVALQPLTPQELADSRTLFGSFMGDTASGYRTVGELLEIYRERSATQQAREDHADSLRVDRFMQDMATDRWREDVVMRIGVFDDTVLVIDGIHRGIAYLGCIADGISPERLPRLHVNA